MAKYDKLQVLSTMFETGMIPVFYNPNLEDSKQILKACYDGGVRAFEFTNRGDFAQEIFGELNKYALKELPGMIMGVGSIVDPGTAAMYIQLGANFIVGPLFNPDVAKVCNRRCIAYTPGCGSISEVGFAQESGSTLIKVFPGSTLGPSFVKGLLAPMPWTKLMVTGGVKPTEENLKSWFEAGVACVGMGSNLFPKDVVKSKEWYKITDLCKGAFEIVKKYKK